MALPTSYLTSVKNLEAILNAIRGAQAPERFTYAFLETLDFKSSSDRLIIPMLKVLGFIDADSKPTDRYFQYLDQTQSDVIMATAIKDAYADLFQVNKKANEMSRADLKGKLKTLTQGSVKDAVIDKMAMTFSTLVKYADFNQATDTRLSQVEAQDEEQPAPYEPQANTSRQTPSPNSAMFGGLHYNIQVILPATRDTKIYDAIFKSMKEHLRDG